MQRKQGEPSLHDVCLRAPSCLVASVSRVAWDQRTSRIKAFLRGLGRLA